MPEFCIAFELCRLEDVLPFGTPETGLRLHWYGLTCGWYDVVIGDQRLFSLLDGDPRGIDYQIARIWEDLLGVAPYVLEPLPAPLAARVRDGDAWAAWELEASQADTPGDAATLATAWWRHRGVGSAHLCGAPYMNLWLDGDHVHVRWRSHRSGSEPAWCSPSGDAVIPVQRFRDELVRFDRHLIAAMQARVDAVTARPLPPNIALDLEDLHREHADRATWLDHALSIRPGGLPPWDDVIAAVLATERHLGRSALSA